MKQIQVSDTSTGQSSTTNTSLAHFPIVFHEDNQDFEYHEGGEMELDEIEFGIDIDEQPEDLFMRELRRSHDDSLREETSQLLFPQEPAEEQEQEMAQSAMPEVIDSTNASEDIASEGQIVPRSMNLIGLSAKWKRILQQFQDIYNMFKKNVNGPKAIGRYLMQHYVTFEKTLFAKDPLLFADLAERLQQLREWVKASKKNSFKLEHLNEFFSKGTRSRKQSQLNRLMMRKILHRCLRDEIIPNNQVKDKLQYLVSTKVFGLRCGNIKLSKRMQMR